MCFCQGPGYWTNSSFPWQRLSNYLIVSLRALSVATRTVYSRSFTSLCYSADGESILAGGQSKFVCIYNIREQILMKKFEISCNLSLDAMEVQ